MGDASGRVSGIYCDLDSLLKGTRQHSGHPILRFLDFLECSRQKVWFTGGLHLHDRVWGEGCPGKKRRWNPALLRPDAPLSPLLKSLLRIREVGSRGLVPCLLEACRRHCVPEWGRYLEFCVSNSDWMDPETEESFEQYLILMEWQEVRRSARARNIAIICYVPCQADEVSGESLRRATTAPHFDNPAWPHNERQGLSESICVGSSDSYGQRMSYYLALFDDLVLEDFDLLFCHWWLKDEGGRTTVTAAPRLQSAEQVARMLRLGSKLPVVADLGPAVPEKESVIDKLGLGRVRIPLYASFMDLRHHDLHYHRPQDICLSSYYRYASVCEFLRRAGESTSPCDWSRIRIRYGAFPDIQRLEYIKDVLRSPARTAILDLRDLLPEGWDDDPQGIEALFHQSFGENLARLTQAYER